MSANKSLPTTSGGCGCCDGGLGNIDLEGGNNGLFQNIIVRHKPKITIGNVIREYNENGTRVYELDDQVLQLPTIVFTNDAPATNEIGETLAEVNFSGLITPGSNPIANRTITPDPGGLDLTVAFAFQKTNVKRTTPGVAELHTVQAVDSDGNIRSVQSGVTFKHAFYQGFNTAAVLDETQIKALVNKSLNDSIIQQYGGAKTYVVPGAPAVPKYIYWVGPVGTQAIVGATLSGFALPLVDLSPVNVTNIHDGSIVTSYWVKRTANLFDPGTYSITTS